MPIGKVYRKLEDSFGIRDVGSTLLDHLAKGLYPAEEVLREYIQNAIDAHRLWRYETSLELENPIQIEVRGDRISVLDCGIGMSEEEVRRVKSIAVTSKVDTDVLLTGHKGVGIWAGLSYFDMLILETTRSGNDEGYRLTINFKQIVASINDRTDIGEVMEGNYSIEAYNEEIDKHSTNITLVNPRRSSEFFTSIEKIKDMVRRICPCELDPNFAYQSKVIDWYSQHNIEFYPIVVDGQRVYRSYPSSVERFKSSSITIDDKVVAQVWQAAHKTPEKLTSTYGELTGFRLIQSGFTLGSENPYSNKVPNHKQLNTSTPTYIAWHIGEIHIVSSTLRPNLQRNQLEESEEARKFIEKLRDFYIKLEEQGRTFSQKYNAAKKLQSDINVLIKKYQEYEKQITSILDREILVTFTQKDVDFLINIQQALNQDEQTANRPADSRESKLYTHLKDKDATNLRRKLLLKLEKLIFAAKGESAKSSRTNNQSNDDKTNLNSETALIVEPNPQRDGSKLSSLNDETEQLSTETVDLNSNQIRNASTNTSPYATVVPAMEKTTNGKESNTDKSQNDYKSEVNINDLETPIDSDIPEVNIHLSQEKILDSTSRKIPVTIVLGLLNQILNEELPKGSNLKFVIFNKLKESIDRTLSNVE